MISNTKQNWTPGSTVKVGFLSLQVIAALPTPGDFAPDAYLLASKSAFYKFVPHNGLTRLDQNEAHSLVDDAKAYAARQVEIAMSKGAAVAAHAASAKSILDWSVAA